METGIDFISRYTVLPVYRQTLVQHSPLFIRMLCTVDTTIIDILWQHDCVPPTHHNRLSVWLWIGNEHIVVRTLFL